jgi:hypothetical protein
MIFKGVIFKKDQDYFVHTQNKSLRQKVYPLAKNTLYDLLLETEVYFELIPNNIEDDEQVEFTARFVSKT